MAVIALPTDPGPQSAQPFLVDFGGELTPFLGGPVQRINRIGTRMGVRVTMPPLFNTDARLWQTRLLRGREVGVKLEWPLPLFGGTPASQPGALLNASYASSVTSVSIKGLVAGSTLYEGEWVSFVHGSYRSLHVVTSDVTDADNDGVLVTPIFPATRLAFSVNDPVEITQPFIQGLVSPGDELGWDIALEHSLGLSFTVKESR